MRFPGFVGGTYESHSLTADAQRTLNLYPEFIESNSGKARYVFHGTPGLTTWATLPYSPIRGLWAGEGRLFAVAGSKLYELDSSGAPINGLGGNPWRGDVGAGTGPVQMMPNGNQLLIIAGGVAYLDSGDAFASVLAPTYPIYQGTFMDGFFTCISWDQSSSRRFVHSALLNGASWDPLDFASKEGYPDALIGMLNDHNDLWLFGSQTTEIWRQNYDTDPTAFPWERDPGAFIHFGITAIWSAISFAGSVAWLGGDPRGHPIALMAQGYQPRRISPPAIEKAWAGYATVSDAESYTYTDAGHDFWVLTFPTAGKTWCYDKATGLWHERGGLTARHPSRGHAYVFGKHLVGDYNSGKIYRMGLDLYDDAGAAITRLRRAPHLSDEEVNIFHHSVQLDMETGLIASPEMSLRWSNDGGKTWGNPKVKTAGALNEYDARVIWRRLGKARDRVYEFSSTAAMRHAWIDAYLNLTGGTA